MLLVLACINEAFILSSAVCLAIGWRKIRQKKVVEHRRYMIAGSILAILFFVSYAFKTVAIGDTLFGGPLNWKGVFQVFLQIHSVLATVAAVLGILMLRLASKRRFSKHKRLGPWTVVIWFITTGSGLAVFLMLYVIYPSGQAANLWSAWIGH